MESRTSDSATSASLNRRTKVVNGMDTASIENNQLNETALGHLRVIELGEGVPVAFAGKCFADLGADVIKIEPLNGDPVRTLAPFLDDESGVLRSIPFLYSNTNKRSVALDLDSTTARDIVAALVESADLVIEDGPPGRLDDLGLPTDGVLSDNPRLSVVTVTPYGLVGPRAEWKATDLTINAASGMAMSTPSTVLNPETTPPLRPGGRQADYVAGMSAATAAMGAIRYQKLNGKGQRVVVSQQASLAAFMRMSIAYRTYDPENKIAVAGKPNTRKGTPLTLWGLVPCKDGYFAFQATEDYQWWGLMRAIGNPEWAKRPEFQDPYDRINRWIEIDPLLREYTVQHTKLEIYHAAQAERVPLFPAYTTREAVQDEQIQSRQFFVDIGRPETGRVTIPGPALRYEKTPIRYRRPWPAIGEHTDEILSPLLGDARLKTLRGEGVIR